MAFDFNSIDLEKEHDNYISDAVASLVENKSVLNVVREQLGVSGFYGFKETYNKDLKRMMYGPSRLLQTINSGTIGSVIGQLTTQGWVKFSSTDFNIFLNDHFPGMVDWGSREISEAGHNSAKLLFSDFIDNKEGFNLLPRIAKLEPACFSNGRYDVKGYISPDSGMMLVITFLKQNYNWGRHCYFVLTGIVDYKTSYNTEKVKINKSLKQTELLTRRACKANYNVSVPAASYKAEILDGHVVLHDSGTYDRDKLKLYKKYYLTCSGINTLKKITGYWRSKDIHGYPVKAPAWYKPKGDLNFVMRGYTGHSWSDIPTIGVIHWADFDPETGKFDTYIWLTGDITYDYKTGKAIHDNVRNVDLR